MTLHIEENQDPAPEDPAAAQVADYLRRHPGFLRDRPKLLAELELAHESGGAVSLIEHQVRVSAHRAAQVPTPTRRAG